MLSESKKLKVSIIPNTLFREKNNYLGSMLRVLNDLVSTAIIKALQLPSGFKEFNLDLGLIPRSLLRVRESDNVAP